LTTEGIINDLEVLFEFQKEGEASEEDVEAQYRVALEEMGDLEFRSTLNQPEDELGVILEINAGAGGTESCDWASMLYRMYQMWARRKGFKYNELSKQDGDVAGISQVELEIKGDYAFGLLKGENGVHRLVRVSPFNAQGKRMTSFASVFVHPLVDDRIEIEINPSDLDWDTFRSSGAGGQHVNKTESAVRVRHLPTGLVVECQEDRSQIQNRERALAKLKSLLYELEIEKRNAERDKIESGKTKNEWGSQIRSYVLDDRRVKDHRTGFQTGNTDAVLDGDLDGFLKAFLMNSAVESSEDEE
jgi:peptide chain release factor 2